MTINIEALPAFWRRAVTTTTSAEWKLTDSVMALVLTGRLIPEVVFESQSRYLNKFVTAYHVITNGVVGPRVERPAPVETRVWGEQPPNDTRVQVLYNDGAIRQYTDTVFVVDIRRAVAWCLNTDLLTAPAPTVVEVTNEDLYEAYKATYTNFSWSHPEGARIANAVNARLRARAQGAR